MGADNEADSVWLVSKGVGSARCALTVGASDGVSSIDGDDATGVSSVRREARTDSRAEVASGAEGGSGSVICTEASAICSQGMGEERPCGVSQGISLVTTPFSASSEEASEGTGSLIL